MHYEGTIIRPPNEADSLLLQVTVGCSHNLCTFCPAYKEKFFRIKDSSEIAEDLKYASIHFSDSKKVFLCDGDALIIPQAGLVQLLENIQRYLPNCDRISTYANAKSIANKSDKELKELRKLGIRMIHMGVESGDDETLLKIKKWGDSKSLIEQGRRIIDAGISLFVTVLLGAGGIERSAVHAQKTGEVLSAIKPNFIGALSLMLVEGTPLFEQAEKGLFSLPDQNQLLIELRTMLYHTSLPNGIFYANHASNYLPFRVRLPRDKTETLALIDQAIEGEIPLKPEWLRRL